MMNNKVEIKRDGLGGYHCIILTDSIFDKPFDTKPSTVPLVDKSSYLKMDICLLCPGNDSANTTTYRMPDSGPVDGWQVRAIENKWPFGDPQNVLILTPEHKSLYDLSIDEWAASIDGFKFFDKGADSIIFANFGVLAGASQPHAHAQIVGVDTSEFNFAEAISTKVGDCVLCKGVDEELVVWQSYEWEIYCPEVPQVDGELRLVSRSHLSSWRESIAEGLFMLIKLTQLGSNSDDFSLAFHVTSSGHSHVHIFPRRRAISVLRLGWNANTVKNPYTYAKRLKSLL